MELVIENELKDKFAKIIQKYLEKQPVIILGTGATIPYGLPSMPELASYLKVSIDGDSIEWNSFLFALEKTGDLEKALQTTQISSTLTNKIIIGTWEFVLTPTRRQDHFSLCKRCKL